MPPSPSKEGRLGLLSALNEGIDAICNAASEIAERLTTWWACSWARPTGYSKRYTKRDILADACIPEEEITRVLDLLQESGVVRRQDVFDSTFYALAGRQVRERLCDRLDLSQSLAKRKIREELEDSAAEGRLLGPETLDRIGAFKERMVFTKGEMGLILASMVSLGRDCAALLDKAEQQLGGFDGDCLLSLLSVEDAHIRERAIRVLSRVKDEGIINPILAHLRKESEPALRGLLVDNFVAVGKRRAIVALMKTLAEIGDDAAKARAIDRIYDLPARRARELLIRIADVEKDPETLDRIDGLLRRLEE